MVANGAYYGTVLLGMVVAAAVPSLNGYAIRRVDSQLETSRIGRAVLAAYKSGRLFSSAGLTFLVNVSVGAAVTISARPFIVPYAGISLSYYRAFAWGLIFTPTTAKRDYTRAHYLDLALEGQTYILSSLASWLQRTPLSAFRSTWLSHSSSCFERRI